ncbi:MAG: aldo/keto reductase [Lacisediminihabitans sp.]
MQTRTLGRTGRTVSVIGLGTWQLGADWGDVSPEDARAVLDAAVASGVTFFDTADVYGDGRSEKFIGDYLAEHPGHNITVATKMGRREAQDPANFTLQKFREWTDRSRLNLRVDTLDLVQLHCPPTPVFSSDAAFDALDTLVDNGAIAAYGVSVETVSEALTAIARPGVATVQIILNAFRLKPLDAVLPAAIESGVGIIARVPLASGLLSGKYTAATKFAENDHRTYNRHGEAFDAGETFSGVDFETGVLAAQEFAKLADTEPAASGLTTAQAALAWVSRLHGVSTVIPGARNVAQATSNAVAGSAATLSPAFSAGVAANYENYFRSAVHDRW